MKEAVEKDQDSTVFEIPDIPWHSVDDFGSYGKPTLEEMREFWEGARPWLANRGVNLYELKVVDQCIHGRRYSGKYWSTPLFATTAPLPYALCIQQEPPFSKPVTHINRRLACARDSAHRDIMIKLVDKDSYQYRIFRCLLNDQAFSDPATFPYVLPPRAIIDTPHKYSFVTMPLWGSPLYIGNMETVREVVRFMDCVLRGLIFLHERRIAHRDICELNIVVNCYRLDRDRDDLREDLRKHRRNRDGVFYALMDYDQSIQLPQDSSLKDCVRSADESWYGNLMYRPEDVALGEPTYNPFAFDVGFLGGLFQFHFAIVYKEVVPIVPAFAALFDKMTTHIVAQRFTAEEALRFFEDTTNELNDEVLDTRVSLKLGFEPVISSEIYWEKLSPEVRKTWNHLRTPSRSWFSHVLRWLFKFRICWTVIPFVRRVLNV